MNKTATFLALLLCSAGASAAVTCRIVSGSGIAFGPYDILSSTPNDSQMNIQVHCERDRGQPKATLVVGLSQGQFGTSVNARRMNRAGLPVDSLSYGLYHDNGRSRVWGVTSNMDTAQQDIEFKGAGSGGTVITTFTVFGRIPAQQDVAAGAYTDSVVVTISP